MKKILLAASFALVAGTAMAQTTTTTTTTTSTDPVTGDIQTYITKEQRTSVAAPQGFVATVGQPLPAPVPLYRLPDNVSPYQYTIVDGHTYLVDENRNIVEVLD